MTPPIICDWLDVTYSPDCAPWPTINRLLLDAGFTAESSDRTAFVYRHGKSATVTFGPSRGSLRASFSGAACATIRDHGTWCDLLSELSCVPHRVTRVDAALDFSMDGADLVDLMRQRYPSGEVNISRKAVKTSVVLAVRPDGRETGTWYAGRRSRARYTARVYDKAWEALQKRGELLPPRARVEVTAQGSDSGATLRDAAEPAALFWHLAAPAILTAPEDAPVWIPNRDLGWVTPTKHFDPAALLKRRVESFAQLDALAVLADDLGPNGRDYLLGLLEKRLHAAGGLLGTPPIVSCDRAAG